MGYRQAMTRLNRGIRLDFVDDGQAVPANTNISVLDYDGSGWFCKGVLASKDVDNPYLKVEIDASDVITGDVLMCSPTGVYTVLGCAGPLPPYTLHRYDTVNSKYLCSVDLDQGGHFTSGLDVKLRNAHATESRKGATQVWYVYYVASKTFEIIGVPHDSMQPLKADLVEELGLKSQDISVGWHASSEKKPGEPLLFVVLSVHDGQKEKALKTILGQKFGKSEIAVIES